MDAIFTKDKKIFRWKKESFDWRLIKLEAFMPETNKFSFNIKYKNIVSITASSFVAYHQVLLLLVFVIYILQKI